MEAADRTFESIPVGETTEFDRTITTEDVAAFARLSGDVNPLHLDAVYAAETKFGKPIVHGMLLASLFSALVGMHLPGKRALYLSQRVTFKQPAYAGDTVRVIGVVTAKSESTKILTLATTIRRGDDLLVEGEAMAQVLL